MTFSILITNILIILIHIICSHFRNFVRNLVYVYPVKVRQVSVRRTKTTAATVSSAQSATMVLPGFADNQSQMAQQCTSAPLEIPGNVVLPNPSVHDTLGVNNSFSTGE